jgi:hypothetical protein
MKEKILIFIFLIILLLTFSGNNIITPRAFAQNTDSPKNIPPRTVLVELFVQEGCLTCPTAEFCLEDLAWEYGTSKFILVQDYECYKDAIDKELTRLSLLEISSSKTIINSDYIIEGTVKNVSNTLLEDLAVCGMVGKEGDESGLYNCIQNIFPFQNMPVLLPGATFSFKYIPEISLAPESETGDEKEPLHLVIFVQNTITKEILQSLYIE